MIAHASLLIDIPASAEQGALIALCSAIGIKGTVVATPETKITDTITALVNNETRLACIDWDRMGRSGLSVVSLARLLMNEKVRARVAIILRSGSMSSSEVALLQSYGFAGVYGDVDPSKPETDLRKLVNWIGTAIGKTDLPTEQKLRTYMKAVSLSASVESPRATVKRLTGLSAESCAGQLLNMLPIDDRRYMLQSFESCFVGREAVMVFCSKYSIKPAQAVELGLALQRCGQLHHVAHQHDFEDGELFYRLNCSAKADALNLTKVIEVLKENEASLVKDRTHGTTQYKSCFIGLEAVSVLVNKIGLSRLDAHIVLQRLFNWRFFAHVLGEHEFEDAKLFYTLRH